LTSGDERLSEMYGAGHADCGVKKSLGVENPSASSPEIQTLIASVSVALYLLSVKPDRCVASVCVGMCMCLCLCLCVYVYV